jgi:heptosyltransferase II
VPVLRHGVSLEGGREGSFALSGVRNADATRSLIVAPQWIGDAVMSEPLLARLAARGEQLTVAALPWVAPVYRAMPQVGEVIEWPLAHGRLDWAARRRLAGELSGRFDAAYVLPNSLKSALIPFLARIPRRVGYRGEGRYGLLNERLPNPSDERPPMVAFYSALAGGAADASERPRLHFGDEALAEATRAAGVERGAYWAFAPGAEYGPAKCWPAEHYAALAGALHREHGRPVLLLGSGKEVALCEQIAADAHGACRVLAGKTSLIDAMALIAAARGVVSNDSGLMHVAAAFGVPQVAVFGSTSPEHTPPLNPRARVLWLKEELQLDCAPCFDRVCRFGHTRCLTGVSAQRVEAALGDALSSR